MKDFQIISISPAFIYREWLQFEHLEKTSGLALIWDITNFQRDLLKKWKLSKIMIKDDQLMGYAILSEKTVNCVHLHRFVINPLHRNKGLGSTFLKNLIADLKISYKLLSLKIDKNNEFTEAFYQKMDFFRIYDEEKSLFMGCVLKSD